MTYITLHPTTAEISDALKRRHYECANVEYSELENRMCCHNHEVIIDHYENEVNTDEMARVLQIAPSPMFENVLIVTHRVQHDTTMEYEAAIGSPFLDSIIDGVREDAEVPPQEPAKAKAEVIEPNIPAGGDQFHAYHMSLGEMIETLKSQGATDETPVVIFHKSEDWNIEVALVSEENGHAYLTLG